MRSSIVLAGPPCLVFILLFNPGYAQGPPEDIEIKAGQAVFVSAVRGDCARPRPSWFNGWPGYLQMNKTPISGLLEPDPAAKREIEKRLGGASRFRVVESADQADFVFHVCSRYAGDVAGLRQPDGVPPDRRLSARALVLPVPTYKRYLNSYEDLIRAALWKADAREYAITPDSPYVTRIERQPGHEGDGEGWMIRPTAPPPPKDASVGEIATAFLKQIQQGGDVLRLTAPPQPQVTAQATRSSNGTLASTALQGTTAATPVQVSNPSGQSDDPVRLGTVLVSVPTMVLDKGVPIAGLAKNDFRLFEDGVEQTITDLIPVESPYSVVLMLDTSESTRYSLADIQAAALAFVEQLRPQDRIMVVSFDSQVYVDSEFTGDRVKLRAAINGTHAGNMTRLYDAVALVLGGRLRDAQGRKAIVVFTDGMDNISSIRRSEAAVEQAVQTGAFVYAIQYNTLQPTQAGKRKPGDSNLRSTFIERGRFYDGMKFLKSISGRTGGEYYPASNLGDVNQVFARVADQLRNQYLLTYYPSNASRDGVYRRLTVECPGRPTATIRAREGYQPPASDK